MCWHPERSRKPALSLPKGICGCFFPPQSVGAPSMTRLFAAWVGKHESKYGGSISLQAAEIMHEERVPQVWIFRSGKSKPCRT